MKTANILIVDDSAYARRLLKGTLEQAGHTVTEASSGMTAIESYFLNRPDVVLLDLTMEDMSGVDVLRRLKEIDDTARVIVISADVQASTEGVVKDAGALSFVGKPATPQTVLREVQGALGRES